MTKASDTRRFPAARLGGWIGKRRRPLKALLFIACLLPLALLGLAAFELGGLRLGANPVQEIIHRLGIWGLRLLLITLAVTPLRRLSGINVLLVFRRLLGLFAFAYICLHFLAYALIDQRLDPAAIGEDILERPYITLGITALLLLVPLAVTSTDKMVRRLGRRWQKLHRLIYPVAILGVWHFYWQVKKDLAEPLVYAAVLALLLGYRLWVRLDFSRPRI